MFLILGLLFAAVGIFMLAYPKAIYEITESWKSNTPGEPSDRYIFNIRFGGVMYLLVGIADVIAQFIA